MVEWWKNGMMEEWNDGRKEGWKCGNKPPIFHYSNIPSFHFSYLLGTSGLLELVPRLRLVLVFGKINEDGNKFIRRLVAYYIGDQAEFLIQESEIGIAL